MTPQRGRLWRRLQLCAGVAICAIGTGLRWRSVGAAPTPLQAAQRSRAEHLEYFDLGQNLAEFKVLGWRSEPSAFRGVIFPAFLSATEDYGSSGRPAAPRIEALLASLEIPLAGWVACELHSPLAGLAAGALVAFHPDLSRLSTPYEIEDFYAWLMMLVVVALTAWARAPNAGRSWALGLATSVSLLCRSVLFLFPPVLALSRRRGAWTVALASYLFLTPWVARNAWQFHRFIPCEDHAATRNFFAATLGVVENVDGPYQDVLAGRVLPGGDGEGRLATMRAAAFKIIVAAPGAYARSCLKRLAYLLRLHGPVILLAGLGVLLLRHDPGVAAAGLLCAYFILIYVPMTLEARYLKPLLPCLLTLAGCALAELARRAGPQRAAPALSGRSASARGTAALAAALCLLVPLYLLGCQRLAVETALLSWPRLQGRGALSWYYAGRRLAACDPAAARRDWEKALAGLGPGAPCALRVEILSELALACWREGRRPEARACLERAMTADGYEVWKKALWLQDRRRLAEALVFLEALAARSPGRADYRTDLGIALALAGRYQESRVQFERALALAPDDPRACLNLGVLRERAGDGPAALRLYDRALARAQEPERAAPEQGRYWLHIALLRDDLRARLRPAVPGGKMP